MSNTNTGGPAYPQHGFDTVAERFTSQGGMTLRDYFAAKAMQSFVNDVGWNSDQQWLDEIAVGAYRQADAMMKARGA